MTSTRARSLVAARARPSARSAVRKSPATPRTPSVPNSLRAIRGLALGELRALARLLEAGLLALLGAGVAREEAAALELAAQVGVRFEQGARDAVAQGAGLGADAAAVHAGHDVHAILVADGLQRLADRALQRRAREEVVQRLAVDRVRAGARLEDHAGDSGLALAGRAVPRARGEVDRRGRDRRVLDRVLVGLGRGLVVVAVLVVGRALIVALEHEVDLEVGAGDRRLLARRLLDVLVLDVLDLALRLCGGCRSGFGDRLRRSGSLLGLRLLGGSGLLGLRLLGCRRLLDRCLLGLLLVVARGVVGHQDFVSIGCGFCATCGWSGPA